MKPSLLRTMLAIALGVVCGGLSAAETPAKSSVSSSEVKKDIEKFGVQRDAMLAERQKLIGQLKTASDEQRKAILEKMKELGEAQRELSKQLRDDMRKQRAQGSPGRG